MLAAAAREEGCLGEWSRHGIRTLFFVLLSSRDPWPREGQEVCEGSEAEGSAAEDSEAEDSKAEDSKAEGSEAEGSERLLSPRKERCPLQTRALWRLV